MRQLTLILFAIAVVVSATPAIADLENCVPALEAEIAYLEVVEPANATYGKALATANAAKSKALEEAG